MKIVSVNAAGSSRLSFGGDHLHTGIFKSPMAGPVTLTTTGIRGDVQVDRKNHGGPDKAICVYSADHYDRWSSETGMQFCPGMFGENLTVDGMREDDVQIGDRYAVGEAEVEVSQPRQPCHKLAKKVGDLRFLDRVIELGLTGFYLRVLKEGRVEATDAIALISRPEGSCSISYANGVMYNRVGGADGLNRLLSVPSLADAWRRSLSARR